MPAMNSLFARFARSASSIAWLRSRVRSATRCSSSAAWRCSSLVQARVLDRGGGLGGERLGPVDVGLAERVRLRALERADADHLSAGAQRHPDPAPHLRLREERLAVGVALAVVDHDGLPLVEHLPHQRMPAQLRQAFGNADVSSCSSPRLAPTTSCEPSLSRTRALV